MIIKLKYIIITIFTTIVVMALFIRQKNLPENSKEFKDNGNKTIVYEKVEPPINKLIRENTLKKYEVGYNSLLYKDVELINNQIGLLDLKEDKTKKYLLFSNLTQLLKYKPELCKSVADLATSLNPEKVDYTIHIATLLGALASSKTAEAEETLAELLKLESHEKISIQAAIYLNNFPNPSNKSIESLTYILNSKPLGSDLYRASLLSLGSVAGNSDKAVSDKIIKSLLKRAPSEMDSKNLSTHLSAMGNSGNSLALNFIEQNVQSKNHSVRKKAISALRHIRGSRSLEIFTNAFLVEKNLEILRYTALNYRYLDHSDSFLSSIYEAVMKHEQKTSLVRSILKNSYLNLKAEGALNDDYRKILHKLLDNGTNSQTILTVNNILSNLD